MRMKDTDDVNPCFRHLINDDVIWVDDKLTRSRDPSRSGHERERYKMIDAVGDNPLESFCRWPIAFRNVAEDVIKLISGISFPDELTHHAYRQ